MKLLLMAAMSGALAFAPVAAQDRMPSRDEKAGFADAFYRSPPRDDPALDASEDLRLRGLTINYLEAPEGSAEELRAWRGMMEIWDIRQQRIDSLAAGVNAQAAWEMGESRRRIEESEARQAQAIAEYNRLCGVFRSRAPQSWTREQLNEFVDRLDSQRFTTEPAPHGPDYVDPAPDRCREDAYNWLHHNGIDVDG
ncbi:MAG: hypothetical protein V4707_06105 [Pseudomonadota bacterium]